MLNVVHAIFFFSLLGLTPLAFAIDNIVVLGLSKGKALINVDGKQHMLALGQISPEGVRLIKANVNEAELEVAGKRDVYPLGQHISSNFIPAAETVVHIARNNFGMYTTTGAINSRLVNFLVDTGATSIALNAGEAKRLGIEYRLGKPMQVSTANGAAQAFGMRLKSVKVGAIELRDVDAVVVDGSSPEIVLLGMSFLGRLNVQHQGQLLVLKQSR